MNEITNKYICVNLDKEEYIAVGELPTASMKDTAVMNTIGYLLATDWAEDRIAFAFEGMQIGTMSPSALESLYEYAINHYDERSVLNKVPQYKYVVNLSHKQYYDKDSIPKGDNGTFFDPLSMMTLSSDDCNAVNMKLTDDEKEEVGIWSAAALKATNNMGIYPTFAKIVPSFRNDNSVQSNKLAGLNIVVTGTISGMTRYEMEKFIESNGGNSQKNVTKRTDYLVVGYNPGNSKLTKARSYGIREITEQEFFDMFE